MCRGEFPESRRQLLRLRKRHFIPSTARSFDCGEYAGAQDQKKAGEIPVTEPRRSSLLRLNVSRILFRSIFRSTGAIISLWRELLRASGGQATLRPTRGVRACRPGPGLSAYLVLLPVGFAMPSMSPSMRCALTAPFHPYVRKCRSMNDERQIPQKHFLPFIIHHSTFCISSRGIFLLHFPSDSKQASSPP
jgi:hypothetical protein